MKFSSVHKSLVFALTLTLLGGCASSEPVADIPPKEVEMEAVSVKVQTVTPGGSAFLDLLGTVEAETHVRVFPGTSGQVAAKNVEEGDTVKKGETLFVLTGLNGTEHPIVTQHRMAEANYLAAKDAHKNTVKSTNAALKMAQLQVQSSEHQTQGASLDLYGFGHNIRAAGQNVALLQENFDEARMKNDRNLGSLRDSLDDLKDARKESQLDFDEMIDNAAGSDARIQLQAQMTAAQDEFDQQIDQLKSQYDSAASDTVLAQNQFLSQLQQAQNQQRSLMTQRDSTRAKLGLHNGVSDALLVARETFKSSVAQSNTALTQAKNQLALAKLNLESAENQRDFLQVKASIAGVVGGMKVKGGDTVSPQVQMTELVGTDGFLLNVGVDIEHVQRLNLGERAQVKIGGRFMNVPIRSVSPTADSSSRLVSVLVELPKINFVPNQTVDVRLPVDLSSETGSMFVPLDAVTIGSNRQFVYVVKDGKAVQVTVKLGSLNGDLVEVVDGLSPGDSLIIDGAKRVANGQNVLIP